MVDSSWSIPDDGPQTQRHRCSFVNSHLLKFIAGEKFYTPPFPPHFWLKGIFQGGGGGVGVYILSPHAAGILYAPPFYTPPPFIHPPPFYTPPTPRRVFSPGVLRSKDFFDPIFVVFRDFCKSFFGAPIL